MESTTFESKNKFSKTELCKYYDYNNNKTEHIFIYGPITE